MNVSICQHNSERSVLAYKLMNTRIETIYEQTFVFLLWETKSVLIRNMKHYGIMKLLNYPDLSLNFISSRAEEWYFIVYLVSKDQQLPSASEWFCLYWHLYCHNIFYLFNEWILPSLKVVVILKLYFASKKEYTTYKKIKPFVATFSDYCLSTIIYLKLKLQVKRQKSQSRSSLSYSG